MRMTDTIHPSDVINVRDTAQLALVLGGFLGQNVALESVTAS